MVQWLVSEGSAVFNRQLLVFSDKDMVDGKLQAIIDSRIKSRFPREEPVLRENHLGRCLASVTG